MEEGTVVKWSKQEGEAVKVGDVLAEIETDKANMEMEALGAGVLRKVLVPAGGKAPVGALIGVIADAGEDVSTLLAAAPDPAPAAPRAAAPVPAPPDAQPPGVASAAPQAPPQPAAPTAAPPSAAGSGGRVKSSPLARAIAAQAGVPLASVPGSGPGGRVVKRDVEAWVAGARPTGAPPTPPPSPSAVVAAPEASPAQAAAAPAGAPTAAAVPGQPVVAGREIPLSGMRRTIARRLSESKLGAPHFYVTVEVDMGPAATVREQLAKAEAKVSYNDLVLRACAKALVKVPAVNASWGGDRILVHAEVHLGVAVAIPDGLITPVVRNADRKSVLEIGREVRDLAARARDKRLKPEEFAGSTFTVSNLGMMDVAHFTAIINPPEAAILAVGSARQVAVVENGQLGVGWRMKATLSVDHRVSDGAEAARFLQALAQYLEEPLRLLM
jgi:pyruvate dehydrogenase E2 component (dihydrolipoamide acetyltransferase)